MSMENWFLILTSLWLIVPNYHIAFHVHIKGTQSSVLSRCEHSLFSCEVGWKVFLVSLALTSYPSDAVCSLNRLESFPAVVSNNMATDPAAIEKLLDAPAMEAPEGATPNFENPPNQNELAIAVLTLSFSSICVFL